MQNHSCCLLRLLLILNVCWCIAKKRSSTKNNKSKILILFFREMFLWNQPLPSFLQSPGVLWKTACFFCPFWGSLLNERSLTFSRALFGDKYFALNYNLHVFALEVTIVFDSCLLFTFCSNSPANIGVLVYIVPRYFLSVTQLLTFSREVLTLVKLNLKHSLMPLNESMARIRVASSQRRARLWFYGFLLQSMRYSPWICLGISFCLPLAWKF